MNLAWIASANDDDNAALDHAGQAAALFGAARYPVGQANSQNSVGWYRAKLGDHAGGLVACQLALTMLEALGERHGQAATWDSLGFCHRQLRHFEQAIACYRRAVALFQETGDRYYEADSLINLGSTARAAGDTDLAAAVLRQALQILDDFDHPDAPQIRRELDEVTAAGR